MTSVRSVQSVVSPVGAAAAKFAAKTAVPSGMNSAQWAAVSSEIRDRAFFSARVEDARILSDMKSRISDFLTLRPETSAALPSRSSFIGQMRAALGVLPPSEIRVPTSPFDVTDITSRARLGMIWDINTAQAFGFARATNDQQPAILDAFPALEFLRMEQRREPRAWGQRWNEAIQILGMANTSAKPVPDMMADSGMYALKNDPVWSQISAFGVPYPPFDFQSGMDIRDVDRAEAVGLGLIAPDETLQPQNIALNDNLQVNVAEMDPAAVAALQEAFGAAIEIVGGFIKWTGGASV